MKTDMAQIARSYVAIVPAAGVGKRMLAHCPKQYLTIDNKTILEHTVNRLLSHKKISQVIVVLSAEDSYFVDSSLAGNEQVITVVGGTERVDSVLAGLKTVDANKFPWVLVHDAARPCVLHKDIDALINACQENNAGGLLATRVRDTMKRADSQQKVQATVDRSTLWHALTPQMYPTTQLISAINKALLNNVVITDESSAMEYLQLPSMLIEGSDDNIKITRPEDLPLAAQILAKQAVLTAATIRGSTCV